MTAKERRPSGRAAHRESGWALDLELRQLRAFVMLVEQGSMTAAARALGVAQSTVSEAVAALERALGTRAVARRRGVHGVALTPAGEALLPYARSVLAALEDAHVAVAAVARDVRASVEVVANESVSTYLLPRALAELRERWPNTQFAVTVGMCPSITKGLASGRFDVGLMLQTRECAPAALAGASGPAAAPSGGLLLTEVPLVAFSGARHPLLSRAAAAQVPLDRLAPYTVFVSDARGHFFDLLRDFFRSDGMPGPRLEPTGSVEAVKRSVATNPLALGVLPAYALAEELRSGMLRALSLSPGVPSVRLEAMLYRARPPVHPAVTELFRVLSTTLGDAPEPRPPRRATRRSV